MIDKWCKRTAVAFAAAVLFSLSGGCATSDTSATDEQLTTISQQLEEIKTLLTDIRDERGPVRQRSAAARHIELELTDAPMIGDPDAAVTLVEIIDYQCPYCARFFADAFRRLKEQYVDRGKLRIFVVDLPLKMHPHAQFAAESAHCAGDQGLFWPMHDALFTNSRVLNPDRIRSLAVSLSLDVAVFDECMDLKIHEQRVLSGVEVLRRQGVTGTPSLLIARSQGTSIKAPLVRGYRDFYSVSNLVDAALQQVR